MIKRLLIGLMMLLAFAAPAVAQDITKSQQYLSAWPTLTNEQYIAALADAQGRQINKAFADTAFTWTYAAPASGLVNTTTAVTIKAAAGAGVKNCLVSFDLATDGALGAATEVAIRDGAAGTVVWRMKIGTAGLAVGRNIQLDVPICGTANTLMEVVTLTASVTGAVYFNAQGYTSP